MSDAWQVDEPDIHYARSGDVSIAYQVVGDGPLDLVFVPFNLSILVAWDQPIVVEFYRRLASFSRLILHTCECERDGGNVAGIAVHIGARVASLAGPGEILVSRTVKDLVAGSELEFAERGARQLKGVPGTWELFAVRP